MANLVTKDDYKRYKGLSASTNDAKIDQIIPAISKLVKSYCGISFVDYYSSSKTELFDTVKDQTMVFLDEMPVVSVLSVSQRSTPTSSYETLVDGTDFYTDTNLGIVYRISGANDIPFYQGRGSVKVVYTSGYQYTPKDIELAVYDLISYYLNEEHKERRSVVNSSIVNNGSSTAPHDIGFPDHIKRILDLYKVNT